MLRLFAKQLLWRHKRMTFWPEILLVYLLNNSFKRSWQIAWNRPKYEQNHNFYLQEWSRIYFFVFLSSSKAGKYVDARRICVEKMKMTHWWTSLRPVCRNLANDKGWSLDREVFFSKQIKRQHTINCDWIIRQKSVSLLSGQSGEYIAEKEISTFQENDVNTDW